MKKTEILAALASIALASSSALAAPLTETTGVHNQPDSSAPIIGNLKAGTEPVAAKGMVATTPTGWLAVELPGPVEGYIAFADFTKALDVKPNSVLRLEAKADAPALAVMETGDNAEIVALGGRWTRIRTSKKIVGYIRVAGPSIVYQPAAPAPSPAGPAATTTFSPGMAVRNGSPVPAASGGGAAEPPALPTMFQGRFDATRRPLMPRRPYDYQIVDATGTRIAYIDVSGLMLTEQFERYVGRTVVVTGVARNDPEAKDIVIAASNLQVQ